MDVQRLRAYDVSLTMTVVFFLFNSSLTQRTRDLNRDTWRDNLDVGNRTRDGVWMTREDLVLWFLTRVGITRTRTRTRTRWR